MSALHEILLALAAWVALSVAAAALWALARARGWIGFAVRGDRGDR